MNYTLNNLILLTFCRIKTRC